MDVKMSLAKHAVVWLTVGLIGGGIAADRWDRQRAAQNLADVEVRHTDQLKDAQARIEQLTKDWDAERQRRQALEGVLADLRKGS